jgi:hypothetical protein
VSIEVVVRVSPRRRKRYRGRKVLAQLGRVDGVGKGVDATHRPGQTKPAHRRTNWDGRCRQKLMTGLLIRVRSMAGAVLSLGRWFEFGRWARVRGCPRKPPARCPILHFRNFLSGLALSGFQPAHSHLVLHSFESSWRRLFRVLTGWTLAFFFYPPYWGRTIVRTENNAKPALPLKRADLSHKVSDSCWNELLIREEHKADATR